VNDNIIFAGGIGESFALSSVGSALIHLQTNVDKTFCFRG